MSSLTPNAEKGRQLSVLLKVLVTSAAGRKKQSVNSDPGKEKGFQVTFSTEMPKQRDHSNLNVYFRLIIIKGNEPRKC